MRIKRLVFSGSTPPIVGPLPGIEIRRVNHSLERKSIEVVIESCHNDGGPRLSTAGMVVELASRPGRLVTTWLAVAEDRAVGIAACVAAGDAAGVRHSIAWLLVTPDARRRGVGTALVVAAVNEALRAGAGEIWAETRADWPAAIAFWAAVGFRPVS